MRILLVENGPQDAEIMIDACAQFGATEIDLAASRDSALSLIEVSHGSYDLAIFDLQIPTIDGALDEHVDHGLAAFVELGRRAPGTIRFVWTGKATVDAMEQLFVEQDRADPFGLNQQASMVEFFKKEKLRECLSRLEVIVDEMGSLDAIEWSWGLAPQDPSVMTKRVVNIFARRRSGELVHAAALGDGFSDSEVLRLEIKSRQGAAVAFVVGKVSRLDDVREELARYERFVAPSLPAGAYTPLIDKVLVGADGIGGAFYTLADPVSRSLFDVVADDPALAVKAVDRLALRLQKWREGAPQQTLSVGDLRRRLISDAAVSALTVPISFEREDPEQNQLYVREATVHGDLHGLNVLVDSRGEPILIDFGEVMLAPNAIDPVTLELSTILHPKSPVKGLWPGGDPTKWANPDEFFGGCPHGDFLRAARKWAHSVAATDREVAAAAYAYCLRQLKYEDVDRGLAEQLAGAALAAVGP